MLETIREAPGSNDPNAPPGPGAATSIVLDWLSFVPTLLLLLRQTIDRGFRLRFTLVHALLAAFAVWTLASIFWADDRFLALISAARIAGGAALFYATTQIATRASHLRVVVGVVVGILLVNVVQGALYQNVEMADMRAYWLQNKAAILAQRGWHEGDYTAQRFEMKLFAGEMLNFVVSANVLGALAVTAALAALGASVQRFKDKDEAGLAGAFLICAASGAYVLSHTASKASWAALALGVALLGVWVLLRERLLPRRRVLFIASLGIAALALFGVVAYGIASHGLPSASLNFRWRYWIGSWHLFLERPLTGVGWGNFADAYLRHRVPAAAEEIQDPHSFLVRWATELGAVGLVIGVAWLIAWAYLATQKTVPSHGTPSEGEGLELRKSSAAQALTLTLAQDTGRGDQRIVLVVASLLLALALTIACTIDFGGDSNYAILEIARRSMFVALIAIAVGLVCLGRRESESEPFFIDERRAPWLFAGLFVGVLMMLLQSTIDMALFQPGPWALMCVMMGALAPWRASIRDASTSGPSVPKRHGVTPSIVLGAAVITWLAMAVPTVRVVLAERYAADGELRLARKQPSAALNAFHAASAMSPVSNYEYVLNAAVAAMQMETNPRLDLLNAIAAAPQHALSFLTTARWAAAKPNVARADIDESINLFGRAIELNPNDVDLRIEFADLLERFGHRDEAADQLDAALRLDDQLDPAEPERLDLRTPGKRETLGQRIAVLRQTATTSAAR